MIAVLALIAVVPVMAQYESLEKGSKIRIHSQVAEGMPVMVTRGYFNAMYKDFVILDDDLRNETVILKDQIIKVEYLQSTQRHALKGLGVGVLVGAIAGVIIGEIAKPKQETVSDIITYPVMKAAVTGTYMLLGSATGGLIGFAIGAGSGTEQWEVVPPVYPESQVAGTGFAALATPRIGVRINF
jgi:hypothetical protein